MLGCLDITSFIPLSVSFFFCANCIRKNFRARKAVDEASSAAAANAVPNYAKDAAVVKYLWIGAVLIKI
jgi:hypothetical protein